MTLINLEPDIHSADQEISGVIITLDIAPMAVTIATSIGTLIDAPSTTTLNGSPSAHWGVGHSSYTVTLEAVGPIAPGGRPFDLIIGPGPWPNLNRSITNHDPEIKGTATFDLAALGVTDATAVSSVEFLFGTGPDGGLTGIDPPSPVPQPASFVLLGSALLGFGLIRRICAEKRTAMVPTMRR